MKKKILMVVNTQIQTDARVLRAARALSSFDIDLLSLNGDENYKNEDFNSIVYQNSSCHGFILNVVFWAYIVRYCYSHRHEYDLFYFHDYPIVIAGYISSILCKKKWVYDAHELLLNHKSMRSSWKRSFFVFLERISIRHANLVVAANDERERIIRYVFKLRNTINVKNIADIDVELPKTKNNYVVFQGAIVGDRDLHPFIDALNNIDSQIKLKIVGGGPLLAHYRQYARDLSIDSRVVFTGRLPYAELIKNSIDAKIGIIVYQMKGLNYIYCEPNKIYEYAQLRLPMLVSPQPKLKYIISKYHIGEILDYPLNPLDISKKIEKIMNDYNSYLTGIDVFLKDYSFEKEKQKLFDAVNDLVKSSIV